MSTASDWGAIEISWVGDESPSEKIQRQVLAYELERMSAPQAVWEAAMELPEHLDAEDA